MKTVKKSVAALLLFASAFCSTGLSAAPITKIDQTLLKAFAAAYPSAEKIIWSEKSGHYLVHFLDHDVLSVIEYDANAQVVQSVRYYTDPGMLPQNIRWEWHRQFAGKALYGVTEVSDGKTTAWFLKGQNANQWITVKAGSDGGMQVVETFKKQL